MAIEIRTVRDDELEAFRDCIFTTFGDEASSDTDGAERFKALIPERQRWAAFEGGRVVATAATFDHAIGVPGGGTLPIAGLTMVSVRPTHRRKGLLRQLIALYAADAKRFGAGGLWASEAAIYGRFGFGHASHHLELDVALDRLVWADGTEPTGRIALAIGVHAGIE